MMTELIIALLAHMPENRIIQGGLINNEIEKVMKDIAPTFYANVKAGEAKVNVDDIVKILNAQKKSQSTSEDSQ